MEVPEIQGMNWHVYFCYPGNVEKEGEMSPALDLTASSAASERRRHRRYRISTAAQVFFSDTHRHTVTIDISSGGVLLKSDGLLPIGRRVQLLLDWPAFLNDRCALRLAIEGKVLRSNPAGTAVEIVRYDYRTRSRGSTPAMAQM
jgi:hypothetical protein